MFEVADPPEIILFFGRFHRFVVHRPIGFLLIAFLLELFSRLQRYQSIRHAVSFVLFLGAWSSILAAGLGYFLSLGGGYDEDALALHQWMGIGTAVAALGALLLKTRLNSQASRLKERVYVLTLSLTVVLMMGAGHYGGSLTHGSDYLTTYFPTSLESFTGGSAGKNKKAKVITNLPEAVVYTDIIQPIFDSRCINCHNTTKQKGDLRLEAFAGLQAGGKGGSVVEAGQADRSELYKRLLLPPEDEHAMPPKGKEPLTESELQLIAWWINEGGAAAGSNGMQLSQNPSVNLPNLEYLNLYGNPITDKGIMLLAKIPHLQKLYLWKTNVTPAGVAALQQKQQELQIIIGNSMETEVKDRQPSVAQSE